MKRFFLYFLIILTIMIADLPLLWLFYFLQFQIKPSAHYSNGIINAIIFTAWAIIHSILARKFAKEFMKKIVGENYVKIVYTIIAGITLSLVLFFWQPIPGVLWQTEGILYWIITILYIGCIIGMIYTTFLVNFLDFLGVRTLLQILKNKPYKPQAFSTRGLYGYCRHPMDLLFIVAFWMAPVMSFGRLEFTILGTSYFLIGIIFEERNQHEEYGKIYELYCANVPMWIPRLKPRRYNP